MLPGGPFTRAESEEEIAQMVDQWHRLGFGHWAVELRETGELIGRTGAKRHADWDLDRENTDPGTVLLWGCRAATGQDGGAAPRCGPSVPPPCSDAPLGRTRSLANSAAPHRPGTDRVAIVRDSPPERRKGFSSRRRGRMPEPV